MILQKKKKSQCLYQFIIININKFTNKIFFYILFIIYKLLIKLIWDKSNHRTISGSVLFLLLVVFLVSNRPITQVRKPQRWYYSKECFSNRKCFILINHNSINLSTLRLKSKSLKHCKNTCCQFFFPQQPWHITMSLTSVTTN